MKGEVFSKELWFGRYCYSINVSLSHFLLGFTASMDPDKMSSNAYVLGLGPITFAVQQYKKFM